MAGIHDENSQRDQTFLGKIAFHQPAPAITLVFRDLGIAIPRQIGEIDFVINTEIVDLGGLAGCRTHPGKILPVQQTIDDGGFPHVGASGKGHLRTAVPDECGGLYRREDKFRFVKVDGHGVPPDRAHPQRWRPYALPRPPWSPAPVRRQIPHPLSPPGQSAAPCGRSDRSRPDPFRFP